MSGPGEPAEPTDPLPPTAHLPDQGADDDGDEPVSDADRRMAAVLAAGGRVSSVASASNPGGPGLDEDMQDRMAALDFVDSLVGVDLGVPERIGDYEVRGLLGRGGMGAVFDAWQVSLEREVALKVLSPAFSADPTMRSRFRKEARATASLHHQHIVPVFDYGEVDGLMFFAMEKVVGISLDKQISAHRRSFDTGGSDRMGMLEPREAARRYAGVADALFHAHRRRLLHRDVKPGNILVHGDGTLALADFGLSKVLGEASVRLSSAGGFMGTLHYASPEQALGADLGPPSDLYSLGVALFETITGRLPRNAKSTESLLQEILHGEPTRLREVIRDAPRDLEAVLEKLMHREPKDRYQDGESLARDLQRIGDGEPVAIRRRSWINRTWRKARANPLLTGSVVTVAVLVVLTLLLMRGITIERGAKELERHRTLLTEAREEARLEPGPPAGPPGVLAGLLGWGLPAAGPPSRVLELLAESTETDPEDEEPDRLLQAYQETVAAEVVELLAAGRGFRAQRLLDARISELRNRYNRGDAAAELALHNAYVVRALARMTPAAADLGEARVDLELARFLRPGAMLPELLTGVLRLHQGEPVEQVLDGFQGVVARYRNPGLQEAAREVMACLLVATAGLWDSGGIQMVTLATDHQTRLAVHRAGCGLLPDGDLPQPGEVGSPSCQVTRSFCELEASILAGDTRLATPLLEEGRRLLSEECSPSSPLRHHRLVLAALEGWLADGAKGLVLDTQDPGLASSAIETLTRLTPPEDSAWDARLLEISSELSAGPSAPIAALRAHAELARRVGFQQLRSAQQWVLADPSDPEARWLRFQAAVRQGTSEGLRLAQDDVLAAISNCVERDLALRRAVEAWDDAIAGLDDGAPRLEFDRDLKAEALRIRDAYASLLK